jgi:contractile injection system tube protein
MGELKKATLQEIAGDSTATEVGDPIEVQFNPTTLRLALSNQIEGGNTQGRTTRQVIGANATVLSLELVFDTADEGTDDAPRSVREKTGTIERFVLPRPGSQGANKNQVPPKVRFQWGGLVVEGVVDSVNVDFDHFAADGTPLRAKVGLSIREQDRRYQFLAAGPGANRNGGAPAPGGLGFAAVGGFSLGLSAGLSLGVSAQVGFALGGETAAEFSARAGLDPGAWRGLGADLSAGLELEAGAEVSFDASLSSGLGLGAAAGVGAASGGSLEAAFGLEPATGAGEPPVAAERQAGFALSAAGGVAAALDAVAATRAEAAAEASRAGFDAPGPQAAAPPDARPAEPPPAADPRAYGYGVPLRPRRAAAADERSSTLGGVAPLKRTPSPIEPTPVPTVPPWERLPARERGQAAAGREPAAHCSCGCRGGKRR